MSFLYRLAPAELARADVAAAAVDAADATRSAAFQARFGQTRAEIDGRRAHGII